jgi:hypothetical protein
MTEQETIKPLTAKPCKHAKQDNLGYTNCTKNDSTIGLCQQPCPYKTTDVKLLQPQLAQYSYIGSYAFPEPLSPREAGNKLRFSTFGYSYILIVAVVGGFYGW